MLILSLKILCQEAASARSFLWVEHGNEMVGGRGFTTKGPVSHIREGERGHHGLGITARLRFSTVQPDTLSTSASSSAVPRVNSFRARELMLSSTVDLLV